MTTKVLLAVPVHSVFPGEALESFMRIAADGCLYGKIAERKVLMGALLAKLRNDFCVMAIEGGFTHIWFIDGDMIVPTEALDRLLAASRQDTITAAVCRARSGTIAAYNIRMGFGLQGDADPRAVAIDPSKIKPVKYRLAPEITGDASDPIRVDGVGMACTMIPIEVLKRMSRPWFALPPSELCDNVLGEDIYFCEHLPPAAAIHLLPDVECGHIKTKIVGGKWATP